SGTSRACGETSSTCASAAVKSAFGLREPFSYCAKRTSALLSGKPTAVPRYFCVIPRRSLKKWILSPIAIVFTLLAYVSAHSIADMLRKSQEKIKQKSLILSRKPLDKSKYA